MSSVTWLVALIPLIPALGAFIVLLLGDFVGRERAGKVATGALAVSLLLAVLGLVEIVQSPPGARVITYELFSWISLGSFRAPAALMLDPLASVMTLLVTSLGLPILIYSARRVREEDGHQFLGYLSLLVAFMLLLVLAENFLVLFLAWEGVGLCAFLLVGYSRKTSVVESGVKAFIVDRIGDVGLLAGILVTFVVLGSVSFRELPSLVATGDTNALNLIGVLILVGALGKSGWLLRTVEGRLTGSALIQGSMIVAAGVYLVARVAGLVTVSRPAMGLLSVIVAVTMLAAAFAQDYLRRWLVKPLLFLSRVVLWRGLDRILLDGGFQGSARLVQAGAEGLRLFQSGNLRFYLFVLFASVVAILAWMVLGVPWAS